MKKGTCKVQIFVANDDDGRGKLVTLFTQRCARDEVRGIAAKFVGFNPQLGRCEVCFIPDSEWFGLTKP